MVIGKINTRQFAIIVLFFTIGANILTAPTILAEEAKQDSWMASLLGLSIGLLLVWYYSILGNRFPNQTFVEYSEFLLGKVLGKCLASIYIAYLIFLSSLLLRVIGDFMTTQIMPDTPIEAVNLLFLVVSVFGMRLGLEVISRAAEIFFPWVLTLFIILILLLIPQFHFSQLQPMLENGIKPILRGSFIFLGLPFLEFPVLLMLFPYVNRPHKVRRAFFSGTLIGGLFLVVTIVTCDLVLGSNLTARSQFPTYSLGKKISIGHFLERIEVIVAIIWFLTIYFKLAVCSYISTIGFCQIFKIKDYRPFLFPFMLITLALSIVISPNQTYINQFTKEAWTPFSLVIGILFPTILLAMAVIKRKKPLH